MRIAINTRFLIRDKMEGLGWHNYELCRELVRQHPEDEFLFLFDRPFDRDFLFADNVRGVFLPPPARRPLLWYLWFEWAIPTYFRYWRPDVFFSPDGYCSLRTRVPTLMLVHDIAYQHYPEQIPDWGLRYYEKYIPQFLQRADHICAISEFGKRDLLAHYDLPAEKISVAPNALRGDFAPIPAERQAAIRAQYTDGQPYFFYLGAVHPRKNIARLIRAFDQFKQATGAPVKLLIGGRLAWQTGDIREAYEASPYRSDIQLLGYVAEQELPELLGSALALTYVSLFEGFGLPILEALHAEVPVITSDRSSMPEVAGAAALLVDPESVDSIAQAMQGIWIEPALRQNLIATGRVQREKYSWAETIRVVYEQLISIKALI